MQILTTSHFDRSYAKAPPAIKRAFLKQVAFLLDDIRHPSLRAKKYDAERWQARLSRDWRFYFRIDADTYILLDIIPHHASADTAVVGITRIERPRPYA
jgi:mRNA-degrading endonuclease RelE of RelBE toxin-antitoxin system